MKRAILFLLSVFLLFLSAGCLNQATETTTAMSTISENTTLAPMPAAVLIDALINAGMPISNELIYNDETDPDSLLGKPNQYWFKAVFSLPIDSGETVNSVEVFGNRDDALARVAWIESTASGQDSATEYTYQSGHYILRISKNTSAADAQAYQAIFEKIVGTE